MHFFKRKINRREVIEKTSLLLGMGLSAFQFKSPSPTETKLSPIRQSVCRWCFPDLSLDELCLAAKKIGLESVELLGPQDWPILQKYSLQCGVAFSQPAGYGIKKGFNRLEHHEVLLPFYEDLIQKAAQAGVSQVICFSGNREGLADELGLINCAKGIRQLLKSAEKHKVTLIMELLNSKIDHVDYQCDRSNWGVALCEMLDSDHFKLLYDIYHMQIMEGDVIRTIQDYHPYIAHYHTAGVPGRHEIGNQQELNYPAIMKAISATGFKGLVAQEFIPENQNPIQSLDEAFKICNS